MIFLLAIVLVIVLFVAAGFPAHVVWLPVLLCFGFIAFWVLVFRVLIGFGRWLILPAGSHPAPAWNKGPPRMPRAPQRADWRGAGYVVGGALSCGDPRCGRVNIPGARFCAQCGRSLRPAGRETLSA